MANIVGEYCREILWGNIMLEIFLGNIVVDYCELDMLWGNIVGNIMKEYCGRNKLVNIVTIMEDSLVE